MDALAASSSMNDPRGSLGDPTSRFDDPRKNANYMSIIDDSSCVDYPGVENVNSPRLYSASTSVIPMEIQLDKG